jgi:hypothetical protein
MISNIAWSLRLLFFEADVQKYNLKIMWLFSWVLILWVLKPMILQLCQKLHNFIYKAQEILYINHL